VNTDLTQAFDKLRKAAEGLPLVGESTSHGTPALKVRGKLLCRVKDASTAMVSCPPEEQRLLIEAAPDLYSETEHHVGWPAILVHLDLIPIDELHLRLEQAWLRQAPEPLARAWRARHAL
jgi:hypothetical protein